MEPILITAENAAKLEAVLAKANGKYTEHVFCSFIHLKDIAEYAEQRVDALLRRATYYSGARVMRTSGRPVSENYGADTRGATRIEIERRDGGWYLTDVEGVTIGREGGITTLLLTSRQAKVARELFEARFDVLDFA